jgi:hypothetical protein
MNGSAHSLLKDPNERCKIIIERKLPPLLEDTFKKWHGDDSQQTPTPLPLILEMISKIGFITGEVLVVSTVDIFVALQQLRDNSMIHQEFISRDAKLTLLTDTDIKVPAEIGSVIKVDNLNEPVKIDMMGKKFDVVLGNPPYQTETGSTRSKAIWPEFVKLAADCTADGGYVSLIHPNAWRLGKGKGLDKLHVHLKDFHMQYLVVGDYDTGKKYFGSKVGTTADWYVAQKIKVEGGLTNVVSSVDDTITEVDIKVNKFIPTCNISHCLEFLANEDEETVEYTTGRYHSQKPFYSKEQVGDFKYPVVDSIQKSHDGAKLHWSSTDERGDYGVSKAICSNGGGAFAIDDSEGRYGLSQFAYGIVDTPENVPLIVKALNSDKFKQLMQDLGAGNWIYLPNALRLLKKDFYKKFQD